MFAERLSVPLRWWFIAAAGVLVGGAEVFAGFSWHVAVIVYVALGIPTAVLLVGMGRARVRVDDEGLHAAGRTLPHAAIGSARALDAAETRHRLGPGHDPNAVVLSRGFIRSSVLVRTNGADPAPYWLVSTRRPAQLLAALARDGAVTC